MKTISALIIASLFLVASCNKSDRSDDNRDDDSAAGETDFSNFVTDLVENKTADNTEPAEINQLTFVEKDEDGAFDNLF